MLDPPRPSTVYWRVYGVHYRCIVDNAGARCDTDNCPIRPDHPRSMSNRLWARPRSVAIVLWPLRCAVWLPSGWGEIFVYYMNNEIRVNPDATRPSQPRLEPIAGRSAPVRERADDWDAVGSLDAPGRWKDTNLTTTISDG